MIELPVWGKKRGFESLPMSLPRKRKKRKVQKRAHKGIRKRQSDFRVRKDALRKRD